MQKSKLLLTTLAICIIIGSIPCVMGQSNASESQMPGNTDPTAMPGNTDAPPMPENTSVSVASISAASIMPNTWYYGTISYVYPWMGSDYTQVGLITSSGTINLRVQPANTNNQYLQTELVNSLVTAHQTYHYIHVYTDQNGYIKGTYTTDD